MKAVKKYSRSFLWVFVLGFSAPFVHATSSSHLSQLERNAVELRQQRLSRGTSAAPDEARNLASYIFYGGSLKSLGLGPEDLGLLEQTVKVIGQQAQQNARIDRQQLERLHRYEDTSFDLGKAADERDQAIAQKAAADQALCAAEIRAIQSAR